MLPYNPALETHKTGAHSLILLDSIPTYTLTRTQSAALCAFTLTQHNVTIKRIVHTKYKYTQTQLTQSKESKFFDGVRHSLKWNKGCEITAFYIVEFIRKIPFPFCISFSRCNVSRPSLDKQLHNMNGGWKVVLVRCLYTYIHSIRSSVYSVRNAKTQGNSIKFKWFTRTSAKCVIWAIDEWGCCLREFMTARHLYFAWYRMVRVLDRMKVYMHIIACMSSSQFHAWNYLLHARIKCQSYWLFFG